MKKVYMIMVLALACIFTACEDNYSVSKLDNSMTAFIEAKYPGAKIFEADKEHGKIQVDIWHDGKEKDVFFTKKSEWIRTEWDVRYNELPQAVIDAIARTQYSDYRFDDVHYVEESNRVYYAIQLEQGRHEVWVSVSANGEIL